MIFRGTHFILLIVPYPVDRPVAVPVPRPYPVTVERTVAVPVDRPVGVPVPHPVPVAVDRPVGEYTTNSFQQQISTSIFPISVLCSCLL